MKTAAEILEDYVELEYDDIIQAMKTYAQAAIEAQLQLAAERALIKPQNNHYVSVVSGVVCRDSILNCPRIELK